MKMRLSVKYGNGLIKRRGFDQVDNTQSSAIEDSRHWKEVSESGRSQGTIDLKRQGVNVVERMV